jgi:inosine-uridine nucleoside N-ribohydrolase
MEFVNKVRQKINVGKTSASKLILSLLDFKVINNTIFHLHDVLAVLLYERPSYFSFKCGNIEIILKGKLRGHSEFIADEMGNVQVATIVDGDKFKNFLYSRLVSLK